MTGAAAGANFTTVVDETETRGETYPRELVIVHH